MIVMSYTTYNSKASTPTPITQPGLLSFSNSSNSTIPFNATQNGSIFDDPSSDYDDNFLSAPPGGIYGAIAFIIVAMLLYWLTYSMRRICNSPLLNTWKGDEGKSGILALQADEVELECMPRSDSTEGNSDNLGCMHRNNHFTLLNWWFELIYVPYYCLRFRNVVERDKVTLETTGQDGTLQGHTRVFPM